MEAPDIEREMNTINILMFNLTKWQLANTSRIVHSDQKQSISKIHLSTTLIVPQIGQIFGVLCGADKWLLILHFMIKNRRGSTFENSTLQTTLLSYQTHEMFNREFFSFHFLPTGIAIKCPIKSKFRYGARSQRELECGNHILVFRIVIYFPSSISNTLSGPFGRHPQKSLVKHL